MCKEDYQDMTAKWNPFQDLGPAFPQSVNLDNDQIYKNSQPGVWALWGRSKSDGSWTCLQVGSSNNIYEEIRTNVSILKNPHIEKTQWYTRQGGEKLFVHPKQLKTAGMWAYTDMPKKYEDFRFFILSDKKKVPLEKEYAEHYNARYWRHCGGNQVKNENSKDESNKGYSDEDIAEMLRTYCDMVYEVDHLESLFKGRKFTLDGHLIGSIGEAIAKNRYGIALEKPSYKGFDGTVGDKQVQIKTVQQDSVLIYWDISKPIPENAILLVLYLRKGGSYYEVYNGPFSKVWESIKSSDKRGYRHISVDRLMKLRDEPDCHGLPRIKPIDLMRSEYKNEKKNGSEE